MNNNIINLSLEKKLIELGAIRTLRAVHFYNFVINDEYLESEDLFIKYCSKVAFNPEKEYSKRVKALDISTKIINYSK